MYESILTLYLSCSIVNIQKTKKEGVFMKKIILTGERPTGPLHIGHYVGTLRNRIKIQNSNDFDEMYLFAADAQALTDNYDNPKKVRDNVFEVALDNLACGIDPDKVNYFIQSEVPELTELTFYYMNLVTIARLHRNPTVKEEIKQKGMNESIPAGFFTYPVSQTSDITAFKATIIPVGDDQLPMIEALLPKTLNEKRLVGIDGNSKMSKSLNNCIYLKDSEEEIKRKVFSMYTDPNHIKVTDPGKVEGNVVFTYLDVFCKNDSFTKYLPEYKNLDELKAHYEKGGLGDMKIKKFLNDILQEELRPIREKREKLEKNPEYVYSVLKEGTKKARIKASETLKEVKEAMKINYFDNDSLLHELKNR